MMKKRSNQVTMNGARKAIKQAEAKRAKKGFLSNLVYSPDSSPTSNSTIKLGVISRMSKHLGSMVWLSIASVILLVLTWMTTTAVGGMVLVLIINKVTGLFTGNTALEHIGSYLWNNPSEAPSAFIELLFG